MPQLFANNAYSALLGALSAAATSLTLAAGTGSRFPTPTATDYFLLTLADVSGGTESAWEIVKVTARVGDVLTVVRAQEGTAARIWNSGTPVDLRITAGTVTKITESSGQMLGTTDTRAIFFNAQTITENLTIKAGTNGGSFGPMKINDDVTVKIEDGAVWKIV